MKIISKSNKNSIIISKKEWQTIGLKSGWINKSSQHYDEYYTEYDEYNKDEDENDMNVDKDNTYIVKVDYSFSSNGSVCPDILILDGDTGSFKLPYDKYFKVNLNKRIERLRNEFMSMCSNEIDTLELDYIDTDDVYKLKNYTKITHTEFLKYPGYNCKITLMIEYTIPNTPPN